ncbi:hypothetical protein [Rufibacter sp. LB8]|nr:hypothetical protein [Rufibacter sp. LB8]
MQKGDIDPPPFFKKWSSMYWLVLGVLAVLILLFYVLTVSYA